MFGLLGWLLFLVFNIIPSSTQQDAVFIDPKNDYHFTFPSSMSENYSRQVYWATSTYTTEQPDELIESIDIIDELNSLQELEWDVSTIFSTNTLHILAKKK